MQLRVSYFLLLILSFNHLLLHAQGPNQSFKRCPVLPLNFEQGLLNNETNSIITDAKGFTWVSTRSGMQRYNGYTLETVNPVIGADTITINTPVFFFDSGDGCIWISYNNGVLEFNPAKDVFRKLVSVSASGNSFFSIVPLKRTGNKTWWIEKNKGIVVSEKGLASPGGKTIFNNADMNAVIASPDILSRTIIADNGRTVFIRSGDHHILCVNTETDECRLTGDVTENIIGLGATADKLFISTGEALYVYAAAGKELQKKIPIHDLFSGPVIFSCIRPGPEGSLFISNGNNLYEFDSSLSKRKQFTVLNGDPVVPTGSIHHVYIDKLKRIWLLTNNDIRLLHNNEIPFEQFIYPGAESNYVRAVYYDSVTHYLLAGCIDVAAGMNGGLRLFDTLSNPVWAEPLITTQMRNINAIEKLSPDHYLVTTYEHGGWFLANLTDKSISVFKMNVDPGIKKQLTGNAWPNNLQRINDTTIFIASSVNVFSCIFKNNELISANPLLPFTNLSPGTVNCFIAARDKTIWAGTNEGLLYLLRPGGLLHTVPIPGNYAIRCFAEDGLHNIWVGTDKGMFVFSGGGKLIKTINRASGLLNDYIYSILPAGNNGSVFAGTKLGLCYAAADAPVKNYTKESGLQGNEFNTGAALEAPDGKLYFGGVNGINAFYPAALSPVSDTPFLNITRLQVNDSLYNSSAGSWTGKEIYLNYPQNQLVFDAAAMGILNTVEYSYSYRMEGFGDSWQTTNHPTGIRYILEPGRYTLEITCSPLPSAGYTVKKTIVVMVYPPWWRSWWFRTLMVFLLASLIIFTVWQYNVRRYKQDIRSLELRNKIQQERERISRDLHDNMGAYAAAIAVNVAKVRDTGYPNAAPALNELQQNSESIVTQLHDTIWALNRETIKLTAISDRFKVFLQKVQPSYPSISFSVRELIVTDAVLSPAHALHLFRMMQEGVNNAVRHSHCSQVVITVDSHHTWIVSVADNGYGISVQKKPSGGNGLANIKTRAAEAGWKVEWTKQLPAGTNLTIHGN